MKLKKIYCYMLVTLLVINSPLVAYAESAPGTISVEGGTIGSGGIEGNSGVLKGTALAVIMATLAGAGITVKLAAEDYARGNSAINYLEDKFEEWDAKTDEAWNAYDKYRALNETKIGEDGSLYIPEQASAIMQKFINWLYANEDVSEIPQPSPVTDTINGTYAADTFIMPGGANKAEFFYNDGTTSKKVALVMVPTGSQYYVYAYSNTQFKYKHYYILNGEFVSSGTSSGSTNYVQYGYYMSRLRQWKTAQTVPGMLIVNDIGQYLMSLGGVWDEESAPSTTINTGFYGDTSDIPQLVDETGNGKILKVNPGLIGQVQDAYVGSNNATINIQDYLDALKDLYGQQALPQDITDLPDIAIQGVDALTGTKEQVGVIDRDIALDQDITLPADDTAITWPEVPSESTSISDNSSPDPDTSIPAMSIDLTQYFPFCLPFDIYNILQKLSANPVTPEITVNWGNILGQYGIDYTMHLDLHDYDNLAELLRNMETAAFVVGLAVVTRQMFLRG